MEGKIPISVAVDGLTFLKLQRTMRFEPLQQPVHMFREDIVVVTLVRVRIIGINSLCLTSGSSHTSNLPCHTVMEVQHET